LIRYGVIGSNLLHSYAPLAHNAFFDIYSLEGKFDKLELTQEDFDTRDMHEVLRGFKGVMVSAPFKTQMASHIDIVDDEALEIGSINTINNVNGKLIGYNTDARSFRDLLEAVNQLPKGRVVVVLGDGGTAKSVIYALRRVAKEIYFVSKKKDVEIKCAKRITYTELSKMSGYMLINATPVGMYPSSDDSPVKKSVIEKFDVIVDLVYNPLFTKFLKLGVDCEKIVIPGLYMLISQAILSQSIWQGFNMEPMTKRLQNNVVIQTQKSEHANIYIVGMIGCGKTELGKVIAQESNKEFVDLDVIIEKKAKKTIKQIYEEDGESVFRQLEHEAIKNICKEKNKVVAVGSGAVLDLRDLFALRSSGIIVFRDRSIDRILSTIDLGKYPNINSKEDVIKMYNERYPRYVKLADYIVPFGEIELDKKKLMEILG
jgi:shikimate dehydrogenase